ncbi:putative atp-dependent rna helicase dbp-3 protein [Phaeoacremonium minimum UCRPA7]|uniref:RNA helicase n=1 Tax=Phaeoacremonium minimum (strain UCR-PA7) TaxID=1286976 RepID=R8BV35_PHAM7|nr:putative atp-dependent rna helicase dbp-3 protein [Phaeoacremonium minimum UCRPA7]EOO03180.1 putative atp-dependent rna helicase dbp-3 protein [Phaeoacremonium minimum UCRPA7]
MSSGKKHTRDAEGDEVRRSKKVKTDTASTAPETNGDLDGLKEEKKRKKDKKEKKHKKEKKEKKDKKEKKRKELADGETAAQEPEADQVVEKPKKSKKSKDKKHQEREQAPEKPSTANGEDSSSSAPYSYKQSDALTAVPESEVEEFLKTNQITVSDPSNPTNLRPILKFSQLPPSRLLSKGPFANFTTPTPIQAASWPYALSGRDVIGVAETGSGKTLAFSVPCVEALQAIKDEHNKSTKGGQALAVIVSPTRELAMQTHAAISDLANLVGMSAVCLYGGASKDDQRNLLRKKSGAHIIVATPGRLKDFLNEGAVSLEKVKFAVLDEADRMLDKGFEEDIKLILGQCPPKEQRQTLMFTATWPTSVRGLAESFMVNPVKITITSGNRKTFDDGEGGTIELQANSRITQTVEVVDPRGKEQRLLQILKQYQRGTAQNDRILVFCLYKKETVRVEQFLQQRGVKVASIHGDLRQEQRTRSLEAFKAGTTSVLLATDVAARGLDIPEVKLVVNLTFPLTIEDYVHRIGRTGRAGKTGEAITLFTEHDKAHSGSLINVLRAADQPVPDNLLKFGTTVKKKAHDTYGAFFKDVDMSKKGTKITFD